MLKAIIVFLVSLMAVSAFGETLTVQPSSIDTYLDCYYPDTNRNGTVLNVMMSEVASYRNRIIINFDFSSLSSNAVITSAVLSLYYYGTGDSDPVGRTYQVYRLTQIGWSETEATWNKYAGANSWSSAGGDFNTDNGGTAIVPANYGWMTWTVTALAQYFQANTGKIAYFIVKDSGEPGTIDAARSALFYSRTGGDVSLRPKLVITYTVPVLPYSFIF